ncbi:MAG: hypothetical protein H2B01_02885 [Nitrosopumilaceae archaeon]|uniref:Uncharacterized protein n=1 Tax=Candidatus Nitrosomaritimum aestuariumsis TaxID=3342354 RepID=A0AC60W7J4_9ARCH|nr:hypothetical protein [Nitrosopumilaceae archaeon]
MRVPDNIKTFALGDEGLKPYIMFQDYWNHYKALNGATNVEFMKVKEDGTPISFAEKEEQMNLALKSEIMKHASVSTLDAFPIEQWANHPSIRWATFAVVSAMIDMVLPQSLIESIGLYTDVRAIGFGDSASFDVKPRDLFVISKAGRAQRTAEMRKQFSGQVTVLPENRQISVQVALYKVLAGKESLAEFVAKAIMSIESEVTRDVFSVFNTAMEALDNAGDDALRYAGYTQATLVALAQKVSAWNGGQRAIVAGTQLALQNILPADSNYRYDFQSDFVKVGYIRTAFGYDVMALPQVADWRTEFKLMLDDNNVYVLSPSANKLVKLVLEGATLSNVSGMYDRANLTQDATLYKAWGTAIATNALAGIITLA